MKSKETKRAEALQRAKESLEFWQNTTWQQIEPCLSNKDKAHLLAGCSPSALRNRKIATTQRIIGELINRKARELSFLLTSELKGSGI